MIALISLTLDEDMFSSQNPTIIFVQLFKKKQFEITSTNRNFFDCFVILKFSSC